MENKKSTSITLNQRKSSQTHSNTFLLDVNHSKTEFPNDLCSQYRQQHQSYCHQREDSAYVSSPDSECSSRHLNNNKEKKERSCTSDDESDEPSLRADESGAESIETDSVFYGNFKEQKSFELKNYCVIHKIC